VRDNGDREKGLQIPTERNCARFKTEKRKQSSRARVARSRKAEEEESHDGLGTYSETMKGRRDRRQASRKLKGGGENGRLGEKYEQT